MEVSGPTITFIIIIIFLQGVTGTAAGNWKLVLPSWRPRHSRESIFSHTGDHHHDDHDDPDNDDDKDDDGDKDYDDDNSGRKMFW